jgi:hypothetical protein
MQVFCRGSMEFQDKYDTAFALLDPFLTVSCPWSIYLYLEYYSDVMYEWISDLKTLEDSNNHCRVQTGPADEQQGILEQVMSLIMHSLALWGAFFWLGFRFIEIITKNKLNVYTFYAGCEKN